MDIYLEEKIGNPQLFTGRTKEMQYFLQWIDRIKQKRSKSAAILSRRKTGKSAIMQRLYNITFHNNDIVIPFYYEIKESKQWVISFAEDFFLTFIYQYIAFKTRKPEYINLMEKSLVKVYHTAEAEGLGYLKGIIEDVKTRIKEENIDMLWDIVQNAPVRIASYKKERIVQFIDEFQFINRFIYRDKNCTNQIEDFAGSYLHTAEYKNAPLLISGSWVGWLVDDLHRLLPARFVMMGLDPMPIDEAFDMVLKYSHLEDVPITEETALMTAEISEGNPFYISAIMRSNCPEKNLTTKEKLIKTIMFEVQNPNGEIHASWMEYIASVLPRINDKNAKKIVLFLSKNPEKELSRKDIMKAINLDMDEKRLDSKLEALVRSDIIERGVKASCYKGVKDNIFDKVFRSRYSTDIEEFESYDFESELKKEFEELKKEHRKLIGDHGNLKGKFAEYVISDRLRYRAYKENDLLIKMVENLPKDFKFAEYKTVWSYSASYFYGKDIQIDILARPEFIEDYTLICEVKNRKDRKFSKEELIGFENKAKRLIELEKFKKYVLIVFSMAGFTKDAIEYMRQAKIAWATDQRWIAGKD